MKLGNIQVVEQSNRNLNIEQPVSCSYCNKQLADDLDFVYASTGAGGFHFCNEKCLNKYIGDNMTLEDKQAEDIDRTLEDWKNSQVEEAEEGLEALNLEATCLCGKSIKEMKTVTELLLQTIGEDEPIPEVKRWLEGMADKPNSYKSNLSEVAHVKLRNQLRAEQRGRL